MTKKWYTLLLSLLLPCLLISSAWAETEGDFVYTVIEDKAKISDYTGSASVLTLPDALGEYPVTAIGAAAFQDCAFLTQVVLPEGIVSLGRNAFEGCTALAHLSLPDSLTRIDDFAFRECAALPPFILHDHMEYVNLYAFFGCSAVRFCGRGSQTAMTLSNADIEFCDPEYPQLSFLAFEDAAGARTFTVKSCDASATEVVFPDGVTAIGNSAFANCASLTQLAIPDGVTSIGYAAFARCPVLSEITIPESVLKIGDDAFSGCGDVVIIAPAGSAAQAYAEANGLAWRSP